MKDFVSGVEKVDEAQTKLKDMDTETLRRYGHQIVDWIVGYLDGIGDYPVLSRVTPGDIQRRIPGQSCIF